MTRLITTDVIFNKPRDAFFKRFPPTKMLGYLVTCDWCMSIWVGSLITISYTIVPTATLIIAFPFALSAIAGFLAARS